MPFRVQTACCCKLHLQTSLHTLRHRLIFATIRAHRSFLLRAARTASCPVQPSKQTSTCIDNRQLRLITKNFLTKRISRCFAKLKPRTTCSVGPSVSPTDPSCPRFQITPTAGPFNSDKRSMATIHSTKRDRVVAQQKSSDARTDARADLLTDERFKIEVAHEEATPLVHAKAGQRL